MNSVFAKIAEKQVFAHRPAKGLGSIVLPILLVAALLLGLTACSGGSANKVVIYTSADENEIALMREMLDNKFPDYQISIEYISTGDHAAKLKAEGKATECDICYELEYGYLAMLNEDGIFAELQGYDMSKFVDDLVVSKNYVPVLKYGGAIIINTEVLNEKDIAEPTCYDDLLKPEYKDLISMPNPKSSGTGYMFYKSLVNAWGDEKALDYFERLSDNILQFTSSGSGPVNSLIQGEVGVAIGMTSHAALQITKGYPVKILFFDEGSPALASGAAIISGKETSPEVQEVFRYFYDEITPAICEQLYPEQIYKDKTFTMENYPQNINYANMDNNTPEEKERLLELWQLG